MRSGVAAGGTIGLLAGLVLGSLVLALVLVGMVVGGLAAFAFDPAGRSPGDGSSRSAADPPGPGR